MYILRIVEDSDSENIHGQTEIPVEKYVSGFQKRKVFKFFRERKVRTIKDEFDAMVLNLFHQYGRAIAFIRKFEPEMFDMIISEYDTLMFDRNKYRLFFDNLYSDIGSVG